MRLVSYRSDSGNSVGLLKDDYIIDLAKADANFPGSLLAIISQGAEAIEALRNVEDTHAQGARVSLDDVEFLPPVPKPPKILCMGLNFTDHAKEGGKSDPGLSRPVHENRKFSHWPYAASDPSKMFPLL